MSEANQSGLHPLGCAVLVEPYEPEFKASRIAIPETVKDRSKMIENRVVVIAIGPAAWPDEPPRAQPGDKVLISKFAGYIAQGPKDGKTYRVINADDIFMRIED